MFKVAVLCFIIIVGLVSLSHTRAHGANTINTPYGIINLQSDLSSRTQDPYQYSMAMLNIMRAFLGYENANFVWKFPTALLDKGSANVPRC